MRIRSNEELDSIEKSGSNTRANRAHLKAAARIAARHAERDYFGRPIIEQRSISPKDAIFEAGEKRKPAGMRLDAWLVANGGATSRERAKDLIATGVVWVNGSNKVKASTPVVEGAQVEVRGGDEPAPTAE